jgi:hypothetical protein
MRTCLIIALLLAPLSELGNATLAQTKSGGGGAKPTTCSEQLNKLLTRGCKRTDLSKSEEQCRSDAKRKYEKCLKTGTWKTRKETLTLSKQ